MSKRRISKMGLEARTGTRFPAFLQENAGVILAFLGSAALMLFLWACKQMIPFGDQERTILRVDLYHQYGPLFAELYERLSGGGSLLFSWNAGLGGGFLGTFFNYLSSLTGLLVLPFGHENVPEAIGTMVLVKCAFASGAFAYMLRKMFQKTDLSVAAFGILYSFCGWFIAYYWNVMWVDAMALLPLVVLGIHYCVHRRKFLLYSVSLALTLISSYYMGYMVCIFSVLFFLLEHFSAPEPADLPSDTGEPAARNYLPLKRLGTFALGSLLGGALAAFALLPVYFALKSSSATSDTFPESVETYFSIFDFFANHFADLKPTFRSSGGDVLPNIYSGVLTLLLAPLYFFLPSVKKRDKLCHLSLLGFFFLSFNSNILNFVWHGMHFPNDLPYRFSFLYSFFLIYMAYKVFLRLKELPVKTLYKAGALAAAFAIVVEKVGSKYVQDLTTFQHDSEVFGKHETIYVTLALLAVYTLLCAGIHKASKKQRNSLALVLFCCVLMEVCAADINNFDVRQVKPEFVAGLNEFQQVQQALDEEDDSFYRMELTDLHTLMAPSWYNYRGVSIFSSMAYEHTANLEFRLGLGGNFINSYTYNPNTPVYNAMHNIKYLAENMSDDPGGGFVGLKGSSFLTVLDQSPVYTRRQDYSRGRFTVFENKYPLSLAFWADYNITLWDAAVESNPFLMQQEFWTRASGGEDVFVPLAPEVDYEAPVAYDLQHTISEEGYVSYHGKPEGVETSIPFLLTAPMAQNAYLYVDSTFTAIRIIRADGSVETRSHNHQAIWDIGMVSPEAPLRIEIVLSDEEAPVDGGFYLFAYGLDLEAFEAGYHALAQGALQDMEYSDTRLTGTITAPRAGVLYTSIPYDESWQVFIDGQRIPVSDYLGLGNGGFLGVPLPKGLHTIELKYVPQGLTLGLLISGAALLLLIAFWLLLRLKTNRSQAPAEGQHLMELSPPVLPEMSDEDRAILAASPGSEDAPPVAPSEEENPPEC